MAIQLHAKDWERWKPLIFTSYMFEDRDLDQTLNILREQGFVVTYVDLLVSRLLVIGSLC